MTTLEIQRRLKALAFSPGPEDGAMGPLTRNAIKAFQSRYGLAVDGIVGPETLAALNPGTRIPVGSRAPSADSAEPPWYREARRLLGTKEAQGNANSSVIMAWAEKLGLWYPDDATAWCGLFVAHCIAASLPEEPLPSHPLGARNWLRFGAPAEPGIGAVLVFWRGAPEGWRGHVGFYAGEDAAAFHVLGGNQGDRVSVARIARTRLLGARWPASAPGKPARRVTIGGGDALSTNEA